MSTTGMASVATQLLGHHGLRVRSTWPSAVIAGLLVPTFFLLAMGLGLGTQISDDGQASLGTNDYLSFIGPGLMATSAMLVAATEGMWPTRALVQWEGVYKAILITPVSARELGVGHVLWIGLRVLVGAVLYLLVLAVFGVPASVWALAMPLVALLVGVVHGAPMVAITTNLENDGVYAMIQRAVLFPMLMFSGALFPLTGLPTILEWFVKLLPIWHGVELTRSLNAGDLGFSDLGHVGYLLVLAVAGTWWAGDKFQKHVSP